MNLKKYKKLYAAISLSFMSFSVANAMEKNIYINKNRYKILISAGLEGKIYRCSPDYVLKQYEDEEKTNIDLLKKLEGKDLGDNLMNVLEVIDNKNIIFEYIDGKCYIDLTKINIGTENRKMISTHCGLGDIVLSINYFIDKWVVGVIEGMEKIHKLTGRYIGDRNFRNFIVKNYGKIDPVLVLIDYDFLDDKEIPTLDTFVDIFLGIMEKNVYKNDKRWTVLYEYLKTIKNETFENADVILEKIKKIKNNK